MDNYKFVEGPMEAYLVMLPVEIAMHAGASVRIVNAVTPKDAAYKRLKYSISRPNLRNNLLKIMEDNGYLESCITRIPQIPRPEGVSNESFQRLKESSLANALYQKFNGTPYEGHLARVRDYFKAPVLE
ncbi:hypothetical protein KW787_02135 [Candidatus Pacearchaeota archaeon]|nr:hypothetical protein [Candidatus Pacearchaeota archaeon]